VMLENDADGIVKNIEVLYDDFCAGVIKGSNLRGDNPLLNTMTTRLSDMINKQCSKPKDLQIPTCLTGKEKRELSELFPEINFDFQDSSYSSHALATAMRHAENYLLARRCQFSNFVDAGGDVVHYLSKLVDNVHVCSPIVDVKDAHRHMTRCNKLDKMKGMCENVDMCENLTQNCDVKYPNIIAVQVYDVSLEDFARALKSHEAQRVDFSMIIPPEIYDEDCDVDLLDGSINVKSEGDYVRYTYGSSGEIYQHERKHLKDILSIQIFEVDGIIYKKTLESSRKQLHFYSIVPCVGIQSGRYSVETHYARSELDKLVIRVPVEDENKSSYHMKVKLDKSCFHNLVEYAMNTVLRLDEKAFEYILSQFRARKSISIRGGKVTQIGTELHPKAVSGLIGAFAGYGLRLREQAHKSAKASYHEFYTPSVFRLLCRVLAFILKKLNNWTHEFMLSVLEFITPKSMFTELTTNQSGIYEYTGDYRFRQNVNVVGKPGKRKLLSDHLETFKKFNEGLYDNLDNHTKENDKFFTQDIQETLNNIFELGGGGSYLNESGEKVFMLPFSIYNKIYCMIDSWTNDEKRASRYTNYICGIWDYFKQFGVSTLGFVKNLLVEILKSIRSGFTNLKENVVILLKKASTTMKHIIHCRNTNWEDQLKDALDKTDEIYFKKFRAQRDHVCEKPSDVKLLNIEELFDICNEGGSGRVVMSPIVWLNSPMVTSELHYYALKKFLSKFVNYLMNLINKPKEVYKSLKAFILNKVNTLFTDDNISIVIDGISFTASNLILSGLMGNVQFLRVFISGMSKLYLQITKNDKKCFGSEMVSDSVVSLMANPGLDGLCAIPSKLVLSRYISSKLKIDVAKHLLPEETVTNIVARDVNKKYFFTWYDTRMMRTLIGISTIVMLMHPKLGLSMVIFFALLNDYITYLRTHCVNASIMLSYGSILKRTIPTARYTKLKSIFVNKFNKTIFSKNVEDNASEDEIHDDDSVRPRVGVKPQDNEPEVVLGYDGKEIKNSTKHATWGSECSSVGAPGHVEGLNFSYLTPCTDRTQINCSVQFPLSHALLSYPLTTDHDFVPTGHEILDCVKEFYHLEAKKLHDELGRLNNAVRLYFEHHLQTKSVRDAVWALRNYLNDSSVFVNLNGKSWYRLAKGDKHDTRVEAVCKYTIENTLIDFTQNYNGVVFCSDELNGMFCNKRCLALESVLKRDVVDFERLRGRDIIFYNKPPGAGKTTEIVNNILQDTKDGIVSVALTHTSNGKREIIHKLKERNITAANKMVYTYDSVLMTAIGANVDRVYCDEVFMVHAGEWAAVMSLFNTNYIRCYGDRNQIPYINRVAHTICRFSKDLYLSFKTIDDNISYRCPVDVCYLLSTLKDEAGNLLYPRGVFPAGDNRNVMRSMDIEPISSVYDIHHDITGKCISFTRPERDEVDASMQRAGIIGQSVQTVHEVQGGTFPRVFLHRLRKYDNPLYENINQFVVSISRHTEKMKYRVITDKMFDRIGERISAISNVQDYIIKEYMFKQRV
nr:replicase [Bean yellow disorder virus]